MANPQCEHIMNNGVRCRGYGVKGSTLCISHNPDSKAIKSAAVMKGANARRVREPLAPITLQSVPEAMTLIQSTVNDIRMRKLSSAEGGTIIRAIRCWMLMCMGR